MPNNTHSLTPLTPLTGLTGEGVSEVRDVAVFEAWLVQQRSRDDDVGRFARAFAVARPRPDSIMERTYGELVRREYAERAVDLALASPPSARRTTSGRQREFRAS